MNDKNTEALSLSEKILDDIESSKISLQDICRKVMRLAKILDDNSYVKEIEKILPDISELEVKKTTLTDSKRQSQIWHRVDVEKKLTKIKNKVHQYVLDKNVELKFGSIPENIFEKTRKNVDKKLMEIAPMVVKEFISVYENLKSNNPEDLANAVHSCRRILKTVADKLNPPDPKKPTKEKNGKKIKIGSGNYINRLIIYIEEHSSSETFQNIVGSNLEYIGNRLDAIYKAASKGTHSNITSREEAERYVIYTYLLLGDILQL